MLLDTLTLAATYFITSSCHF